MRKGEGVVGTMGADHPERTMLMVLTCPTILYVRGPTCSQHIVAIDDRS